MSYKSVNPGRFPTRYTKFGLHMLMLRRKSVGHYMLYCRDRSWSHRMMPFRDRSQCHHTWLCPNRKLDPGRSRSPRMMPGHCKLLIHRSDTPASSARRNPDHHSRTVRRRMSVCHRTRRTPGMSPSCRFAGRRRLRCRRRSPRPASSPSGPHPQPWAAVQPPERGAV